MTVFPLKPVNCPVLNKFTGMLVLHFQVPKPSITSRLVAMLNWQCMGLTQRVSVIHYLGGLTEIEQYNDHSVSVTKYTGSTAHNIDFEV